MTSALVTSVLVGIGVGMAHYAGHSVGGSEESFEDAGVGAAGVSVVVAATVATYTVLTLTGVA